MRNGRWKKLATAGAILTIGIVAALMFRRDEGNDQASAVKKLAPEVFPKATAHPELTKTESAKLSGQIEPVAPVTERVLGGAYSAHVPEITSAPDETRSPATPSAERAAPTEPPHVKPVFEGGRDVNADSLPARSPLKWQTVQRADMPVVPDDGGGGVMRTPVVTNDLRSSGFDKRHRIVDGDSLRELARQYLSDENRYLDLFEFNRDVLINPDLLPIGAELRIPPQGYARPNSMAPEPARNPSTVVSQTPPPATAAYDLRSDMSHAAPPSVPAQTPTQSKVYVVQPRDTLPFIARKLYGDISRQSELLAANREQLHSPKDLRPGMTLLVPAPRKP